MGSNPVIGPTGPHGNEETPSQPVTGGAAAKPKKIEEEPAPETEGEKAQPVRNIGPTGPRGK